MQPYGQFDTGVEVGRNDTAMRRAEPGRSVVRSLAARVLTVALLATLAALAAPQAPPLQAQTVTTLVSNTHLTAVLNGGANFHAQSFVTGANAGGYTVSEVDVQLFVGAGRDTSVKIRENNADNEPGDLVATLTNPGTFTDDSPNTFTAPAGTTLAASTTYWISVNEGITSDRASLGVVSADDETGETSWSIGDGRKVRTDEAIDWGSNGFSLLIAIKGTAITTFVSNTHLTSTSFAGGFLAQSFETGANAGGYSVSEVDVVLKTTSGRSTSVKIRENNVDNEPGELVTNLDNPDTLTANIVNTFTAPAGTTLAASETYWISVNEGISSRATLMIVTSSDETGEPGWSIGDDRLHRGSEGVTAWSTGSDESLMIAVKGTGGGGNTLSNDAKLSGLTLEDGDGNAITLDTIFASDDYEYEVTVANGIDAVKLTAAKNDANAKVVITNDDDQTGSPEEALLDLSVGSNELTVTVTAEDTTTELTYTVTVERQAPYVCVAPDLSGRSEVWSGTVTVGTNGTTYGYQSGTDAYGGLSDTEFDYGGNDYIIEGIIQFSNPAFTWVKIDLDSSFPHSDRSKLSLHICEGTFSLTAASFDDVDNDYTVSRTSDIPASFNWPGATTVQLALSEPLSDDAKLSGLTLEDGDGNDIPLDTEFASDDYEYEVSVANGIDAVKLTAAKSNTNAKVVITNDDDQTGSPDEALLDLIVGSNELTVTVTAEDTTERTYTITVERAATSSLTSDDARLSALSVSPRDIIGFYGPHTSYEVGVDPTVDVATVSATVNHAGASLVIYPVDADTAVGGHQVGLLAGSNVVTVSVTAEDGLTKREYTLSVNRGVTDAKGWQAGADLDGLIDGRNEYPRGIWSDETTVWVADAKSEKLFAYTLADGMRDAGKDITLDANNNHPDGIWSNGTTVWVADWNDAKLYAYTLADATRDSDKDITPHADNTYPTGIWADETTMWVADHDGAKLYAYMLSDGTRDAGKEFTLHADNANPAGIWSDETTMWVADDNDDKLYAYTLSGGMRDADKDITLPVYPIPAGLWSDGTTMWVADRNADKLYAYTLSGGTREADKTITLDNNNNNPYEIWSDGTTMWVVENGGTPDIFAYTLLDGMPDADKDITPHHANNDPRGIWSDGTTMWVVQTSGARHIYAYTLADGMRDAGKDIKLRPANANPTGIWSNGTTMWVMDRIDDKLYAYTLVGGMRDSSKDIALHFRNGAPSGIWSNGTTMWVADQDDEKLYAYTLSNAARDEDRDFDTASAGNGFPQGIWSDGTTMWVSDWFDQKVYAYNMPPADEDDATLRLLNLSNVTLAPPFVSGTRSYTASVGKSVTSTTVTAQTTNPNATRVIKLEGTEDADGTVDLAEGDNIITVVVTAEDGATTLTYTVTVTRAATFSTDATLSSLNLNNFTLDPTFASGTHSYTASVGNRGMSRVTAQTTDPNATRVIKLDGVTDADGTVDLAEGENSITVVVTAEDTSTTLTYTVTVTRDAPLSNDATLSSLSLSDGTLDPTFMSGTQSYTASVANSVTSTMVTAETTDPNAAEPVIKLDGTEDTDGTVDLAEGANSITVEVTAEDTTTTLTYTVTVTRATDTANLVLSRSSLSVGEAGSDTFTVKLATLPSGSVTVTVTSDDTDAATVSPASLTFTTTNWNSTQTVTVSGEDDSDTDNESLTVTASASGGGYTGKTATVNVDVTDDDTANLVLSRASLSVGEAGSDTFTVKLATLPSGNVTVTVTSDDTGAATVSPASLTFTTTNWNTTQQVTVSGEDDTDTDNESLTVTASASGGGYGRQDGHGQRHGDGRRHGQPGVEPLESERGRGGQRHLHGEAGYAAQRERNRHGDLRRHGAATVSPASLTFTTTNWNSTQTVTVSGEDDSDTDNESLTVTASASGGGYTGKTATVNVDVTDDDTANLVLSRASLSVGEAGSDTFTVKLATLPSANVTVTVSSDDTGAATVSPASLTFTTTNWNTTQHLTVSGEDDTDTANESLTVTASASGGGYGGKTATVNVTVTDNDTGVTTVTFGASSYTATEGGSSATVVVRLSQAPATQVTIPLTTMHRGGATGGDYTGIPDDVRFTSGQTQSSFTVTAVDDSFDDDGESVRIGFDQLPSGYAQGSPAMTTVALVDDEGSLRVVVGFTTHWAHVGERRESESRFKVPVRLDREPLRSVTIPLVVTHLGGATAADYTGIPESVTFGPNDTKADFFMYVIPDEEREIGERVLIDFGDLPSSVSKDWWGSSETIEFVDDLLDSTVWFGTDAYTATEGGAAALVSIHLDAPVKLEPLEVRLVLRYGGGATAADHGSIPAVVRFAIGQQTKTITVAATNDSDDDDGESVTLSFVNVSGDRVNIAHQPTMANTTMVSLADDDGPKPVTVSFGAATYTAREGGSGASVSVELDATPGRSVTVPLTTTHRGGATGADYSGVPSSVTFGSNETQSDVHGDGDERHGGRRRREPVDRVRDAAGKRVGGQPGGRYRGARRRRRQQRAAGQGGVRHGCQHRIPGARKRLALSDYAEPEPGGAADRDDSAGCDARGRRDCGGLHGDPGERDVRAGPEESGLQRLWDAGRGDRDRRGPADRLRHAAAGRESGLQGVIRNRRVRGYVHRCRSHERQRRRCG